MEQEPLKKPEEVASAEKKTHKKLPLKLPVLLAIAAVVIIAGIGGLLLYLHPWQNNGTSQSPYKKSVLVNNDKKDLSRTKVITIDPLKEQQINIYTDKKVRISLDIPKGVFKETHRVIISPYITTDPANPVKILIYPQKLAFRKPVTVTFDLSRSTLRSSAPEYVGSTGRVTGSSQLLFTDKISENPTPTLISRSTETSRVVTARILGTGLYSLTTDGKSKSEYAHTALKSKNSDVLTILESASAIVFNNEQLSSNENKVVVIAVNKIKDKKGVSPYDKYAAFALDQKLSSKKVGFSMVGKAYAAINSDQFRDLLRFSCGKESESAQSLAVTANTAKLMGFGDVEKKCMDHARTLTAEKSKKLLQSNPTKEQLLEQIRENQSFELPKSTSDPLQAKVDEFVKKEVEEYIKTEPSYEELLNKLSELQMEGNIGEEAYNKAQEALFSKAYKDAKAVASDPNSTPDQILEALAKAELRGIDSDGKSDTDLKNDLNKRLSRTPQQILESPNSTFGEVVLAFEETRETDPELHKKLLDKKTQMRHLTPVPTFKPEVSPTPTPAENGADTEGMLALVIFKEMLGGESFTEQGYRDVGKKVTDWGDEGVSVIKEACAGMLDYVQEFGADDGIGDIINRDCGTASMDMLDKDIADGKRDIEKQARDIGISQEKYEGFDDNEDDWHIEIDITPTPEKEAVDAPISDWADWNVEEDGADAPQNPEDNTTIESYSSENELNSFGSQGQSLETEDSSQKDVEVTEEYYDEEVQGISTTNKINSPIDSILKFLHLKN